MSLDIGDMLGDWPYEDGEISARRIVGDDGADKIQLRLDLGLLQMETEGHPAGIRPHGHESLLDYYEHMLDRRRQEGRPEGEPFLDQKTCELLRNEGVMYYHRYLAEFILEDYEAAIGDITRNLRLMDFCAAHARDESDRMMLEQHRPYVLMMRTRASGLLALRDNHLKDALVAVRKGIAEIRQVYRRFERPRSGGAGELAILRSLAKDIEHRIPPDPIKKIKSQLALAVKEERYEEAAGLRDQLRVMTHDEGSASDVP